MAASGALVVPPDCALIFNLLTLFFFFFNSTTPSEIFTLSLHDALPILRHGARASGVRGPGRRRGGGSGRRRPRGGEFLQDRKSTRLNSSHTVISYAVFCLKKKITRAFGQ